MIEKILSIIVIGYNIESYISRCLESIYSDELKNSEVIFVDDGSTDKTVKIAKGFEYRGLKIVKKQNGGIVSARKAGLQISSGKYILFFDGDDNASDDFFKKAINLVENWSDTNPDIIVTDPLVETKSGEFRRRKSIINYGLYKDDSYAELILEDKILHYMFSKLYKRSFLIKSGYMDYAEVNMAEDLMTNAILGLYHPIFVYADEALYCYRMNGSSMSRAESPTVLKQTITLEYIEKYFSDYGVFDTYKELLEYRWFEYAAYIHSLWTYSFKKRLFDQCRPKLKGIKKNEVIRSALCKYGLLHKVLFWSYYYDIWALPVLDRIIVEIRKFKGRYDNEW